MNFISGLFKETVNKEKWINVQKLDIKNELAIIFCFKYSIKYIHKKCVPFFYIKSFIKL